jgi:hypothetical protein
LLPLGFSIRFTSLCPQRTAPGTAP